MKQWGFYQYINIQKETHSNWIQGLTCSASSIHLHRTNPPMNLQPIIPHFRAPRLRMTETAVLISSSVGSPHAFQRIRLSRSNMKMYPVKIFGNDKRIAISYAHSVVD